MRKEELYQQLPFGVKSATPELLGYIDVLRRENHPVYQNIFYFLKEHTEQLERARQLFRMSGELPAEYNLFVFIIFTRAYRASVTEDVTSLDTLILPSAPIRLIWVGSGESQFTASNEVSTTLQQEWERLLELINDANF